MRVTQCEVVVTNGASVATVKAFVSDPDNVGYRLTLVVNGSSKVVEGIGSMTHTHETSARSASCGGTKLG